MKLQVIQIPASTRLDRVTGTLWFTLKWGMTVTRGGRLYRVEIVK